MGCVELEFVDHGTHSGLFIMHKYYQLSFRSYIRALPVIRNLSLSVVKEIRGRLIAEEARICHGCLGGLGSQYTGQTPQ